MIARFAIALVFVGCGSGDKPAPPQPEKTNPLLERPNAATIQKAKKGVEAAQKATEQRTDDAYDRATRQESAPTRSTPSK
jgi:hypothetical protein